MPAMDREPCPWRVVDDAGGAFVFGLVGGTIWHSVGGVRNAPKGHRIAQAIARVKARTPILGGSFAIWGTLFSCFDCTFTYIRKKEDPWNAIFSGAATGGLLAARAGMKAAGKNALVGGVILAAIEGLNIAVNRVIMPMMEKRAAEEGVEIDRLDPPNDPLRAHMRQSLQLGRVTDKKQENSAGLTENSAANWRSDAAHHEHQIAQSTGFDINSVASFDEHADDWQRKKEEEEAEAKAVAAEQKPFWRVW